MLVAPRDETSEKYNNHLPSEPKKLQWQVAVPGWRPPKGRAKLGAGRGPPPYTPLLQGCSLSFLLS